MICNAKAYVSPHYLMDNLQSCDDEDLKDAIANLNNKPKSTDKKIEINDSSLPKENESSIPTLKQSDPKPSNSISK